MQAPLNLAQPRRGTAPAPAASATLAILRYLAKQQRPTSVARIVTDLALPRSTVYQLLGILCDEGFVTHLYEEQRYCLGFAAFEVGAGFGYQQPLVRMGRPILSQLVRKVKQTAHLSVLHGRDVLYVLEERAPNRPPLVTDEGVTLPSHLTASGRVILAGLPDQQVRALFPTGSSFSTLQGTGPDSLPKLRQLLAEVREKGYGFVDDDITPGVSSIAACIVDREQRPIAALAVTYYTSKIGRAANQLSHEELVQAVQHSASQIQTRLVG